MKASEYLPICASCKHRSFNRELGLVCGLTYKIPDFGPACPDYAKDHPYTSLLESRELEAAGRSIWKDLGNACIGILLLILGGITLRSSFIVKGCNMIRKTMN